MMTIPREIAYRRESAAFEPLYAEIRQWDAIMRRVMCDRYTVASELESRVINGSPPYSTHGLPAAQARSYEEAVARQRAFRAAMARGEETEIDGSILRLRWPPVRARFQRRGRGRVT